MRAKLEHIKTQKDNNSILCYEVVVPSFEFYWHFHPEYELTYIIKGKGRRMVGDSIENFAEGDLILLGPDTPHTWVSDKLKRGTCRAMVIQFSESFMEPFLAIPEIKKIKTLLSYAKLGIHFIAGKKHNIEDAINQIYAARGVLLLTSFFNFLNTLSGLQSKILASSNYQKVKDKQNERRINKVLHYIQHNFKERLSLHTAAGLIHLSESAFCKYFKRSLGKTFSDYVNEIRIAHACSLLIETDRPISTIAYECGFENVAYFNRIFLKKKNVQPGRYRKV